MSRFRTVVSLGAVAAGALTLVVLWRVGRTPAAADAAEADVATDVAVQVGKIATTTLHRYVVAYGSVEPQPATSGSAAASARVATPVAGIVTKVDAVEGQRVASGATLVELDSRVADVAVARAREALHFAEVNFQRQKTLQPGEGTSQKLYQEAEQQLTAARNDMTNAETQRALLTIRAPMTGTIVHLAVRPGDAVDLSSVLAEMMDLDRLVVNANVRSVEAALLKLGQAADVSAGGETTAPAAGASAPAPSPAPIGVVTFLGAAVDAKTDTIPVRISVPSASHLRPGQFVTVRVVCEVRRDRLVVPETSVMTDTEGRSLIATVEGDKATKRPVTLGLREGGLVEIAGEGLKDGMTVVTVGVYGLPKESKIRVIGS
jgi:membrane fusion protein, multidrug efflux system